MCWLAPDAAQTLFARLATIGLIGGAVYDALVGEAAQSNGCRLLTRDLRARRTYELLGASDTSSSTRDSGNARYPPDKRIAVTSDTPQGQARMVAATFRER